MPDGEMIMLSAWRQEYLIKVIFYGQVFGHRPNTNQARICVLGFGANRVWLVSPFHVSYIIFDITTKRERSQYQLYSPM